MGDIVKRIDAVALACAAPCQEGCGNEAASEMAHLRARRAVAGMLLLWALLFLLATLASFALPVQRAWADDGICGYAYLEPNADDPSMYTLVIQKEQRTESGAYRELGPVPENATGERDLPWYEPREREKIAAVKVSESTGPVSPTSTRCWFYQCWNVRSFDLAGLDSSSVTDMSGMFTACESVRSLDLSCLNTSSVTSMAHMFSVCFGLRSLSLSELDTSKVTSMAGMMAGCHTLESVDLSGLNTSNVTSMRAMFSACFALTSVNLTGVDTSCVTDMSEMFRGCSSLAELDLSAFKTAAVTDVSYMFDECSSLASVDLSSFDFLKIKNMERMFSGCVALTSVDLSKCGTDSVGWHGAGEMFRGCRSLTSVTLPQAGAFALSSARDLFKGCYSLKSLDIANVVLPAPEEQPESPSGAFSGSGLREVRIGPKLANAEMLEGLFSLSSAWAVQGDSARVFSTAETMLEAVEKSSKAMTFVAAGEPVGIFAYEETTTHTLVICPQWKPLAEDEREFGVVTGDYVPWADEARSIEKVRIEAGVAPVSTAKWFYWCDSLTSIEGMENLDTSNVTDMSSMFYNCVSLSALDVGWLDTSSVTDFSSMFYHCQALTSLDVGRFETGRATSLRYLFQGCSSLAALNVSGFDTSRANYLDGMFSDCSSLTSLDVGGFQTGAAWSVNGMFGGCSKLLSLDASGFDLARASDLRYLFSRCESLSSLSLFELDDSHPRDLGMMLAGCSSLHEIDLSALRLSSASISNAPSWGLEGFFSGCDSLDHVTVSAATTALPEFPAGMWSAAGERAAYRYDEVPGGVDATYEKVADKPYFHALLSADGTLSIGAQPVEANAGERLYQLLDEGYASAADVPWHDRANDVSFVEVGAGVRPASVAHWFEGCTALASADLSGLDTSGVSDFSSMFYGCSSLAELDLSGVDTRAAASMRRMFHGCRALESVKFGDAFTFRGSAWSRLPGSELPSGAWQEVDAQGAAIDADRAYASDSIPSFKEAAYRKIDETRLGLTIESVRGDSAAGTAKYTVETQLVPVEDASTELEAVSDYTLDDNYKGVFTIGDTAKASSWKPLSNKTITSATVRSVASKNVTTIRIGPQVAKIKAKAFAASPNVTRLEVQSDKLTTRGSVNNCLFKSKVSTVSYDSRMKKRLKVKYAFEHYAGKKVK